MYHALCLSPTIPSYNVGETVQFFQNLFGFSIARNDSYRYVIMHKDNLTLHVCRAGDIGEMQIYLEVDELDWLWDSIKNKLDGVKTKAPFDRDYGMREFHIIIPHTKTLMLVGQEIKPAPAAD